MYIANHLKLQEFACKCSRCQHKVGAAHVQLLKSWEYLRETLNEPIRVSSGFRCTYHNWNIGGVANSQHLIGKAMDLLLPVDDTFANDLFILLLEAGFKGIGRSKNFIHADVRDDYSFWMYDYMGRHNDELAYRLWRKWQTDA